MGYALLCIPQRGGELKRAIVACAAMSPVTPIADIRRCCRIVRFVPKADIRGHG